MVLNVGMGQFCQQNFWKNTMLKAKSKMLEKIVAEGLELTVLCMEKIEIL